MTTRAPSRATGAGAPRARVVGRVARHHAPARRAGRRPWSLGPGRAGLVALVALVLLPWLAVPSAARAQQDTVQQQIRASQERLQQIRAEREKLQKQMQSLEGRARNISSELGNIERQVEASASALKELDYQAAALAASVEENTQQLVQTRDRLRERNVVLTQRLRSIYKDGPMHAVRVLLSAENFSDLLNRYKYLHLISVHDRMLLEDIRGLETQLSRQEQSLKENLAAIERIRADKLSEFARLQSLERSRTRALKEVRGQVSQAGQRIQQLARDEERLNSMVEELERKRLEAERRRAARGVAGTAETLSASSLGKLQWPLDGQLLYRFGPERRPNGITLRRNGIGIVAVPGTPVHAIAAGTVVLAQPMEGFGPGVVLSHGGGYYSLYLYLGEIRVQEGQDVAAGQVIGTVGDGPEEGPHLYLQIHAPVGGEAPIPVDPLPWLQPRR